MHPWLVVLLLACSTATISMTVTKSTVMEPFREGIKSHSQWFGKLFSCPYCFSHWTAFVLVWLSGVKVFPNYLTNFGILSFATVAIATIVSAVMWRLFFLHEDEIYTKNKLIEDLQGVVKELLESQD
jgi:hypothetical protein